VYMCMYVCLYVFDCTCICVCVSVCLCVCVCHGETEMVLCQLVRGLELGLGSPDGMPPVDAESPAELDDIPGHQMDHTKRNILILKRNMPEADGRPLHTHPGR
jgi:hypothetical protein